MICDITKQRIPLSQLAFFHLAVIRWSTGRARLVCFDSVPDAEVTNNEIRELYADPAKRDELIERLMEYVKLSYRRLFRAPTRPKTSKPLATWRPTTA